MYNTTLNDDTINSLGKLCLTNEKFRWVPGMLARRVPNVSTGVPYYERRIEQEFKYLISDIEQNMVPDVSDSATQGCLLSLIRDLIDDPYASLLYDAETNTWFVRSPWLDRSKIASDSSSADALVRALNSI